MPWITKEYIDGIVKEVKDLENKLNKLSSDVERIRTGNLKEIGLLKENLNSIRDGLEEIKKAVEGINSKLRSTEEFGDIGNSVGLWKASTCGYRSGGICTAWKIDKETAEKLRKKYGPDSVKEVNGILRVVVDKVPLLCAFCPLYKPAKKSG